MAKELAKIQNLIYGIREQQVMLDSDLAALYEVEVKVFNQAVKRNRDRFPSDFMFQLTQTEWENLRSQIVTSSSTHGGRRYLPYVFTEQGIAMLSGILNSKLAVQVNIQIMRAFVNMRKYLLSQTGTNEQITELRKILMLYVENTDNKIAKHEKAIRHIMTVLDNLIEKPPKTRQIGFTN